MPASFSIDDLNHGPIDNARILKRDGSFENILKQAIKEVNDELKLNVPLGISIDFGSNYAECH